MEIIFRLQTFFYKNASDHKDYKRAHVSKENVAKTSEDLMYQRGMTKKNTTQIL